MACCSNALLRQKTRSLPRGTHRRLLAPQPLCPTTRERRRLRDHSPRTPHAGRYPRNLLPQSPSTLFTNPRTLPRSKSPPIPLPYSQQETPRPSQRSRHLRRLPPPHPPLPPRLPQEQHPNHNPRPQHRRNNLHHHLPLLPNPPLPRRTLLRIPKHPEPSPQTQTRETQPHARRATRSKGWRERRV